MKNVEHQIFNCNNETFTRGTYNGISVIIRDKDGFINATEMCNQFDKKFRKIFENHTWQAYLEAFKAEYTNSPISGGCSNVNHLYQIPNKGIPDRLKFLRGSYVNPKLINYIAIWASPQYAITVGKIMDEINERGQLKNISSDENINEVLKQLKEENEKLKEHINNTSVPIENSDKDLYIYREDGQFKISADSNKIPNNIIYHFIFPASMNIRQMVHNGFGLRYNTIPEQMIEGVIKYLELSNPKEQN